MGILNAPWNKIMRYLGGVWTQSHLLPPDDQSGGMYSNVINSILSLRSINWLYGVQCHFFFPHFRPCDDTLENSCLQIFMYSRAYESIDLCIDSLLNTYQCIYLRACRVILQVKIIKVDFHHSAVWDLNSIITIHIFGVLVWKSRTRQHTVFHWGTIYLSSQV